MTAYGATPEEWTTWATSLGLLADLLPVVSNPNASISPHSSIREVGKTPSYYNEGGQVVGFKRWSDHVATASDISAWSGNPDYGICIQTRTVHAFDVDCDDPEHANRVREIIAPYGCMIRVRDNSARFLAVFRPEMPFKSRGRPSIEFASGNKVEFWAIGKQFIAAGTHPSGARYRWLDGVASPPMLSVATVESLWDAIERLAPERPESRGSSSGISIEACLSSIQGGNYHDATRDLAWIGCSVEFIRTAMEASPARTADAKRWQVRYDDIPRLVETARLKRADEAKRVFGLPAKLPAGAVPPDPPKPFDPEARRKAQLEEAAKIGEGEDDPDELRPVIMTLPEMIRDLIYVGSTGAVVHLPTRRVRRGDRARDEFRASRDWWIDGNGNRKESENFPQWIESPGRKSVDLITWSPGDDVICDAPEREEGGSKAVNLWGGWNAPEVPDDWRERLGPWHEHLAYLIPDAGERAEFEQWLAHIAQKPGELPHRFYLMIAKDQALDAIGLRVCFLACLGGMWPRDLKSASFLTAGSRGDWGANSLSRWTKRKKVRRARNIKKPTP